MNIKATLVGITFIAATGFAGTEIGSGTGTMPVRIKKFEPANYSYQKQLIRLPKSVRKGFRR